MNKKNTRRNRRRMRKVREMKDDNVAYALWVDDMTRYLRGCSCGSAVDIIIAYAKMPDLSRFHLVRLIQELTKLT